MASNAQGGRSGGPIFRSIRLWRFGLVALGLLAILAACARDQATLYAAYSEKMQASGRFRTDIDPPDAPFTPADVARNLERVAFEPEAQLERFYRGRNSDRRLSKWTRGPTYALLGDGVRPADFDDLDQIAARLSRATGLSLAPIAFEATGAEPDITIFIIGRRERLDLANRRRGEAWYAESIVRDWIETPNPPCFAVLETATPEGGAIERAAIFLKAELEAPLRQACLTEELTQSLGPIFDHPEVRPSIFNDDQEFIDLTRHDEAVLRLLYAPELRPGMRRTEAKATIARILARDKARLVR